MLIAELIAYFGFAALLAYRVKKARSSYEIAVTVAFLTFAAVLAAYEGFSIALTLLGVVLFEVFAISFGTWLEYPFFFLGIEYLYFFSANAALVAQAVLLGLLAHTRPSVTPSVGQNPKTERNRDITQIAAGAVIVAVFWLFAASAAKEFVVFFILIGYLLGGYAVGAKKGAMKRFLLSLERKGTEFGQGAKWLAIGSLIAVAFLPAKNAAPVLASILIGDALATLFGIRYKKPLFYNKSKSIVGTLVYFVSASAISYLFVGYWGIVIGAIGAAIESLPKHIDDNVDTAVVLTLIIGLAPLLG